jgi:hypothetical protein
MELVAFSHADGGFITWLGVQDHVEVLSLSAILL